MTISIKRASFAVLSAVILLDAMAAYSIMGVPVPWIGALLAVFFMTFLILFRMRVRWPEGSSVIALIIAVGIVVNLLNWATWRMPPGATLSYNLFILARYVDVLAFLAVFLLTYNVAMESRVEAVSKRLVFIATIIAGYALYAYVAQLVGLWELPRTRMGTGGQDFLRQAVAFSSGFHRALGTFQEPSHMAVWLLSPLLLVLHLAKSMKRGMVFVVVIGTAFLLAGSLTGVLALLAGLFFLLIKGRGVAAWIKVVFGTAVGSISLAVLQLIQLPLFQNVLARLNVLLGEGVYATNRGYIAEYVSDVLPPLFGYGFGNANIVLAGYLGSYLMPSHLSLFVNLWMSLGVIGLVLLGCLFFTHIRMGVSARNAITRFICAGYISWMIVFLGVSESFQVMFAVIAGMLVASVSEESRKRYGAALPHEK